MMLLNYISTFIIRLKSDNLVKDRIELYDSKTVPSSERSVYQYVIIKN
jgi:hypothetical protein